MKTTHTTGIFFKSEQKTYNDFQKKLIDSKLGNNQRDKRETVLQKLLEAYAKHGDNLFNISDTTPF